MRCSSAFGNERENNTSNADSSMSGKHTQSLFDRKENQLRRAISFVCDGAWGGLERDAMEVRIGKC